MKTSGNVPGTTMVASGGGADLHRCCYDFSVIVPSFNPNKWLLLAVNSIAHQEQPAYANVSFEVIVVDDASTLDSSRAIFSSLQRYPFVRLFRLEHNSGPAAARNFGIHRALGRWICFLDADDIWMPYTFQAFLACNRRFPRAVWFAGDHTQIDALGNTIMNAECTRHSELAGSLPLVDSGEAFEVVRPFFHATAGWLFPPSFCCIAREAICKVGGFDESLRSAEDHDLWLKMSSLYSVIYIAKTLGGYRINPSSITNTIRRVPYPNLGKVYAKHMRTTVDRRLRKRLRERILDVCGDNIYHLRKSGRRMAACKESLALVRHLPLSRRAWRHVGATLLDFLAPNGNS